MTSTFEKFHEIKNQADSELQVSMTCVTQKSAKIPLRSGPFLKLFFDIFSTSFTFFQLCKNFFQLFFKLFSTFLELYFLKKKIEHSLKTVLGHSKTLSVCSKTALGPDVLIFILLFSKTIN